MVKNPPAMQETLVQFLSQEDPLEKGEATHSSILGLLCGLADKVSACNAGDLGSISGLGGPLKKGTATHSSIVAGEFRDLYSPWGCKESDTTE